MNTDIFEVWTPKIMHCSTGKTWKNCHCIHAYRTSFCMNHVISHLTCACHMKPVALCIYSLPSFIKMHNWRVTQQFLDFSFKRLQFLKTSVFSVNQSSRTYFTSITVSYTHLTLPTIY